MMVKIQLWLPCKGIESNLKERALTFEKRVEELSLTKVRPSVIPTLFHTAISTTYCKCHLAN